METYSCFCPRFIGKRRTVEAESPAAAALRYARVYLPGPDRWGQSHEEQYTVHVTDADGAIHEELVHCYYAMHWDNGPLE